MAQNEALLSLFDIPAEAESTNRGFAVQYLDAVREWFRAFGSNRVVYCELYDDVAVDNPETLAREFRQIKSYKSKSLGLGDEAVKHTLYLFYRNFMYPTGHQIKPKFSFVLDGTIRPRDQLLQDWAKSEQCPDVKTAAEAVKKSVEEQLTTRYERLKKQAKLASELEVIETQYQEEQRLFTACDFEEFATTIFLEVSDKSLRDRLSELVSLVSEKAHTVMPPHVLVARCFQEVALRASDPVPENRVLTQALLSSIMQEDEGSVLERLSADHLGKRVITIMTEYGFQLTRIENKVDSVAGNVAVLRTDVSDIKTAVNRMIADREELTFPLIDEVLTWIETYLLSDIIPEDRRPVDETDAKIAHNKLSDEAAETIYETYADFPQVRDFLRQTTGRRGRLITSAIKQLYRDRRAQDQSPDDIFWGLIRDVTPPRAGEAKRYACTVLISYFFHACEVFERVNPRQI